jgi:hypothetical protein
MIFSFRPKLQISEAIGVEKTPADRRGAKWLSAKRPSGKNFRAGFAASD